MFIENMCIFVVVITTADGLASPGTATYLVKVMTKFWVPYPYEPGTWNINKYEEIKWI